VVDFPSAARHSASWLGALPVASITALGRVPARFGLVSLPRVVRSVAQHAMEEETVPLTEEGFDLGGSTGDGAT
jgi:hypothetical protein